MKIQALNKTQQKRLLSLCKEFFPEYEYIWWNSCYLTIVFEGGKSSNNKSIDIHWYQLCLTELPKRIYEKLHEDKNSIFDSKHNIFRQRITTYHDIIREYFETFENIEEYTKCHSGLTYMLSTHPVDFLYEFVNYCKKNKYFRK